MKDISNDFIKFLSNPLIIVFLSIFLSILAGQVSFFINRKRLEREKLRDICRQYILESHELHKIFAGRIFNNDGTNLCNVINESEARGFKRRLTDDIELYRLMKYLSIKREDIDGVIQKYDKKSDESEYDFYNLIDELRNELLKIEKQI